MTPPRHIAVCVKWVARRPEVDPVTGVVSADPRTAGMSDADQAAVEHALTLAGAWGATVTAVTAGRKGADAVLREALGAGCTAAVRVDLDPAVPSAAVGAALADAVDDADVVLCGDYSLDRGTGSVPAFIAAARKASQALGLVSVSLDGDRVRAIRRLDGGRREHLLVSAPMVLSVEPTVRLRRADVTSVLAAGSAAITVVPGPSVSVVEPARVAPYRPRARVLPPPASVLSARERILALTGTAGGDDQKIREEVVLDGAAAADKILEQLATWGYRPAGR